MPETLLEIKNLKIHFPSDNGWQEVVHGIDFTIQSGRTLGIVGESGSGKSVSCLSVMHLLDAKRTRVTADAMLLGAQDIKDFNEKQMADVRGKRIAMIFQEPMTSLNPVYRCGQQVSEMIRQHEKVTKQAARDRTVSLFKQMMLPNPETVYDKYPHELSGGQKQRVMIAMAIACNPQILIADEPTTALDVTVQKEILKLLRHLQQETGMGMVFITHDLGVVSEIADDVLVMHNGHVMETGTVQEVLNHPKHPYTQGLLACRPPMKVRLKKLPVVKEFLEGRWSGGKEQIMRELLISEEERQQHLTALYAQKPILTVEHLKTWYPTKKGIIERLSERFKAGKKGVQKAPPAVNDVCLEVFEGETLGLVGESGCGKTTLGLSILRLIEPTEGKVFFDGMEVTAMNKAELRDFRKQAQIVFQDPYSSLNPRITIGEAIAEPIRIHGIERDRRKCRRMVNELLEQVGLEAKDFDSYPHQFSGGQRQRICIARALAINPRLVICDESVSALDVSVQAQVLNLLNRLKEERHLTYIFISHDLGVVRFMSDRVLVMYKGQPVEYNDADELFDHPQNDYTKKLIAALPGNSASTSPTGMIGL